MAQHLAGRHDWHGQAGLQPGQGVGSREEQKREYGLGAPNPSTLFLMWFPLSLSSTVAQDRVQSLS